MTKPNTYPVEPSLQDRADTAMKTAIEKLKVDHARRGLPLYIWQDGKVVEVSAEQLRAELGLAEGTIR
jgi:hypothetical protein